MECAAIYSQRISLKPQSDIRPTISMQLWWFHVKGLAMLSGQVE